MKAFAVIVALAMCQMSMGAKLSIGHPMQQRFDNERANRAFEDTIIATLECVREEMKVGWEDWGLPSFEPLIINDHTFDLNAGGVEGVSGSLNVQDTNFEGLTGFEIGDVKGTIGLIPPSYTVKLTLNFPKPKLDTKYDLYIDIDGDVRDDEGTLYFEANDFVADVELKATIIGGINLQYFTLIPSLGGLDAFEITGVRGDEEYSAEVSKYILENGPQIIDDVAPIITEVVETAVLNLINNGFGDEDGFLNSLLNRCLGGN